MEASAPFGRLVLIKKTGGDGAVCEMLEDQLLIGREDSVCDIVIRLPEVSKRQAILKADGERQVWVQNLSKTNPGGTMLNDEPLSQPRMLTQSDVISICGRHFRFEYRDQEPEPEEAMAAPEQTLAASSAPSEQVVAATEVENAVPAKATTPKVAAKTPKMGGSSRKEFKENDNQQAAGGRTPSGHVDRAVLSALKARRSFICHDEDAATTPSDDAAPTPSSQMALKSARKSVGSARKSAGWAARKVSASPRPASPDRGAVGDDADADADAAAPRPSFPSALMAAIAARAQASPAPMSARKGGATPKRTPGSGRKSVSKTPAPTPMEGVFAGLEQAVAQRASSIALALQSQEEQLKKVEDAGSSPHEEKPMPPSAKKSASAKRRKSSLGVVPTPNATHVDAEAEPVAALIEVDVSMDQGVHAPPVQPLVGVPGLPESLSLRAMLPTPLRKQISARRKSSVGSLAAAGTPKGTPKKADTPAKKNTPRPPSAAPREDAAAPAPAVDALADAPDALAAVPVGLRSAIKSAAKRRRSSLGGGGVPSSSASKRSGARVSFGADIHQPVNPTPARFAASVAPPNTPADGVLALNAAMPIRFFDGIDGIDFQSIQGADASELEVTEEATEGPSGAVGRMLPPQIPVGRRRGSVKFDASDPAPGRKPIRASSEQTPGHREASQRRTSRTPKAQTPTTAGGATLEAAADYSATSAAPGSRSERLSTGGKSTSGKSTSTANRHVESAMEALEGLDTDALTPTGLEVVSGLMGPSAPLPAAVTTAVHEAGLTPNAADVIGQLLNRKSMGIASSFSPMKAVETAEGSVVAMGIFAIRPSPAASHKSSLGGGSRRSSISSLVPDAMATAPGVTTEDILAAAEESMGYDEEDAADATKVWDEAGKVGFASPLPKGGRTNAHIRFGPNATPYPKPSRGVEAGIWVARVGYNAEGDASLTLLEKRADAGAVEAEWSDADWADWEAQEWAAWEAERGAEWEVETGCYPWQFDEEELAWEEEAAALSSGTPQPPGGRSNSHIHFDHDEEDEYEGKEDEADDYTYEEEDYEYDYGEDDGEWDGLAEDGPWDPEAAWHAAEWEEDDLEGAEAEAFGQVGVLSAVKGPAPTPVAAAAGGSSLDLALGSATPAVSAMRKMTLLSRSAARSAGSLAGSCKSMAASAASGLLSIAKSYASEPDDDEDEAVEEEDNDVEEEEEDNFFDDLPVAKLFGTPAGATPSASLTGTFSVAAHDQPKQAEEVLGTFTPVSQGAAVGIFLPAEGDAGAVPCEDEPLASVLPLGFSARKSAKKSASKSSAPKASATKSCAPRAVAKDSVKASPVAAEALEPVFPVGFSARKGDKAKQMTELPPAVRDQKAYIAFVVESHDQPISADCQGSLSIVREVTVGELATIATPGGLAKAAATALPASRASSKKATNTREYGQPTPKAAAPTPKAAAPTPKAAAPTPKAPTPAVPTPAAPTPFAEVVEVAVAAKAEPTEEAEAAPVEQAPLASVPRAEEVEEAADEMAWTEDVRAMKVAELRAALEELGLDTAGKKAALVDRLIEALTAQGPSGTTTQKKEVAPAEEEAARSWSSEEIGAMKVAELREACGALSLDATGKKAVLVERLLEALALPPEAEVAPEPLLEPQMEEPKRGRRGTKRASMEAAAAGPPTEEPAPRAQRTTKAADAAAPQEAKAAPRGKKREPPPVEESAAPGARATRSRR